MKIEPFAMERMQSTWENLVELNLSESGVHPMTLQELLIENPDLQHRLLNEQLGYGQSNGTIELREQISAMYPGSTIDSVLVTNGTSEANFISIWNLVEKDDEVALMLPNYMQIWGIVRCFHGNIRPFHLREENRWKPDFDELRGIVTEKTKLIVVCNPNNPTGAILSLQEMDQIVAIAERAGCWLLIDEVYQGAERNRDRTPSFWGHYDKVIITNGLSKAYGLPGLRIGWVVAPAQLIAQLWGYHDYTTIGPGILSDMLARFALTPKMRDKIRARTQNILRTNYPILADWIHHHGDAFTMVEPDAGAIAYLRYRFQINSTKLVDKLLHEKSVLVVPGDHFGMDHYLRIGYGSEPEYLRSGLERIHSTLLELFPAVTGEKR